MSNPYATLSDFFARYDQRSMLELSGDNNNREGQPTNIQILLDDAASEMEASIGGMYALPLASPPTWLTRVVCVWTAYRLFQRRSNAPKGVKDEKEWADKQMENVRNGTLVIANNTRQNQPNLADSDFVDGRSRWDYLWGRPSPTGPSKGQ